MAIAARFRHTFVIERRTPGAATPRGHVAVTYVDDGQVRGLVQEQRSSKSGSEITGPDLEETVVVKAIVFLPIDAAVTEHDRLRRADTGARYRFTGPLRDAGGRGRHLEAEARRVKP